MLRHQSVSDTLEPITDVGFAGASIVTDGLVLHLDAGNTNSYSGSGNTWNDISGKGNHFDINNVATYNNNGYFIFNSTLNGGVGMIGPASNSFGLSQTNHTIEIVLMPTAERVSHIMFYMFRGQMECCGAGDRINGTSNIVGHHQLMVPLLLNSGNNDTTSNNFTNTPVTIGGFMYNNNSSDHSVSARLYSVKRIYKMRKLLVIRNDNQLWNDKCR